MLSLVSLDRSMCNCKWIRDCSTDTCTLNLMTSLSVCIPKQVHLNRTYALIKQYPRTCVKLVPMCFFDAGDKINYHSGGAHHDRKMGLSIYYCHLFFIFFQTSCRYNQLELLKQGTKLMMASRRDFGRSAWGGNQCVDPRFSCNFL